MARARKKARKKVAKRATKKTRRAVRPKAKRILRKPARRRAKRRARPTQEGPISQAVHTVVDSIEEAAALRRRLAGRDTFEDQ